MNKPVENNTGSELIVVKQLPVIEDQLLAVKERIEARVNDALSMICTEDTYKDIKKIRSDLNKEYQELEKRRKEIKGQILAPYEKFEGVYKECAGDLYASADRQLGEKIREVENGLKQQKADDLAKFFDEYRESLGLPADFVQLEAAGIKIGLSDSKVSLHRQATEFLDRISSDLKVIETQENRDEILAEYAGKYNLSAAMLIVDNRHKMIAAEKARREEIQARQQAIQTAEQAVQETVKAETPAAVVPSVIQAPVKSIDPEAAPAAPALYKATFTVTATIDGLKALKQFLNEGGYQYEC